MVFLISTICHYIHEIPQLHSTQRKLSPVPSFMHYFCKNRFNIIVLPAFRSLNWCLFLKYTANILHAFLSVSTFASCLTRLIFLDLITVIVLRKSKNY